MKIKIEIDEGLAEEEIVKVSGGNKDNRIEEETENNLQFLEKDE